MNKAAANLRSAKWRATHPERRKTVAIEWTRRNADYICFIAAKRRARKLSATPRWADFGKIKKLYELAQIRRLTVDHIVPLVSKLVCGLHCQDNLQLLPAKENIAKNNRYWPDMP